MDVPSSGGGPFVGRTRELDVLLDALEELRAAGAEAVQLEGPVDLSVGGAEASVGDSVRVVVSTSLVDGGDGGVLVDGRAQIVDDEKKAVYCVVLYNYSDHDLWPYLVSMDSAGYSISMVYHPDAASPTPPLRAHSHMVIGSGTLDSEALSFTLADDADTGAGFLKLFVSSVFTPMSFIEQGVPTPSVPHMAHKTTQVDEKHEDAELWDSVVACVNVVRKVAA